MGQQLFSEDPPPPPKMAQHDPAIRRARTLDDICHFEQQAKKLGQGTFGVVFKGNLKQGGKPVAVKMIEKANLKRLKVEFVTVSRECEMMRECIGNDSFVQLFDFVEMPRQFCLILEFCNGGNLQDGAMSMQGALGEIQVRLLMQQMLGGIEHLHARSICHRDVKPHNYFLIGDIRKPNVRVKLGDFGASIKLARGKLCTDQVGTPAFMAPEIHLLPRRSRGYDHKVDVWAIGVSMIFLLANEYPFMDGKGRLLRERIIKGGAPLWEANMFENLFQGFQETVGMASKKRPSRLARELTRRLLAPCPKDRLSASDALRHEWFVKPIAEGTSEVDNLPLLDMMDFEAGFSQIERGWGGMIEALSNVQIGSAHSFRNDSTQFQQPNFARPSFVMPPRGAPQNFLPPPPPRHLQHANSFGQSFQHANSFGQIMPPLPPPSLVPSGKLQRRSSAPAVVHPGLASKNGSTHFCCLCKSESTMFDHVCPQCSVTVCAACISERLPQGDLRCPSCNRPAEDMRILGGVHDAKISIGSLLSTALGSIASSLSGESHQEGQWQSGHWLTDPELRRRASA